LGLLLGLLLGLGELGLEAEPRLGLGLGLGLGLLLPGWMGWAWVLA
jgi:hypothetical protein